MSPLGHPELLSLFALHAVPFVVIGGHAVSFHGHIRATEDVDVVWLRTPTSEAALLALLRQINARFISDEIDPATNLERLCLVTEPFIQSHHLMMLVTDLGFLDLFDYVPGCPDADVRELFDQAIVANGVRYASLSWLKRMKQAAGRPQDQADLENLGR